MKGQPFFFDSNIFDDDHQLSEEELAAQPEFTKDEMEQAKKIAFEEGKKAGFEESENEITNKMLTILQKIEHDISRLFEEEDRRNKIYEEEALHLSAKIFTKSFPKYMEVYGREELKNSIITALSDNMTPEKITITLNENLQEALSVFIKTQEDILHKKISLKTDNNLSDNDCRINWSGGGIICNRDATIEKIFDILNQSLAERNISLHDDDNKQQRNDTTNQEKT